MQAFFFALILSLPAYAAIFGSDDRIQPSGALLELAHSTALQVPLNYVSKTPTGLDFEFTALSDRENYAFCSDEPFAAERVSPIACTGFLVAPDLLVTAGHCAVNWTRVENTVTPQCEAFGWLFDYQVDEKGTEPAVSGVEASKLARCKTVVYANFVLNADAATGKVSYGEDIALIRLDHSMPNRKLFELAPGTPGIGEKVTMIGYPLGLPTKVDFGKTINYGQDYFRTDLDVAGGNSGSPVLNAQGKVAGVLVRSFPDADFVDDAAAGCRRWNHCSSLTGHCESGEDAAYTRGSEAQRIQALLPHLIN
ncbi:MAG: trypsin-like serine peptidase [Bdellovibrionota bacterium]